MTMRTTILENLSVNTIHKLVRAFDERRTIWYPSTITGLEESITHNNKLDMLSKCDLLKQIVTYGDMLKAAGQDSSNFESFPAYFAFCNVESGFKKYKAKQIARSAASVFGNVFTIFLAHGIHNLFLSLAAMPRRYESAISAKLIERSFDDDFFEKLLDYVHDAESLADVGDAAIEMETIAFCRSDTNNYLEG